MANRHKFKKMSYNELVSTELITLLQEREIYQDSFQELVSLGDHGVTETMEQETLVRLQGMVILRLKVVSFRIM